MLALFVGERITISVVVGAGLIVFGIWFLTRIDSQPQQRRGGRSSLFYPFVSVIFYGITTVFKKIGLSAAALPTLAALITQMSSLIVILSAGRLFGIRPKWKNVEPKSLRFFAFSGVIESLGSLFTFIR